MSVNKISGTQQRKEKLSEKQDNQEKLSEM